MPTHLEGVTIEVTVWRYRAAEIRISLINPILHNRSPQAKRYSEISTSHGRRSFKICEACLDKISDTSVFCLKMWPLELPFLSYYSHTVIGIRLIALLLIIFRKTFAPMYEIKVRGIHGIVRRWLHSLAHFVDACQRGTFVFPQNLTESHNYQTWQAVLIIDGKTNTPIFWASRWTYTYYSWCTSSYIV